MTQTSIKNIKLTYNVIDRSAKKIATLVKIANLTYQIQQNHDEQAPPHILHTPSGQLHKEYEIINYVIMQSRELSKAALKVEDDGTKNQNADESESTQVREAEPAKVEGVVNLQANDSYITAKMYEKLHELRVSLFPLLQEFYKYLTGNEKTKKSKYDSLMNKIKKEIGVLDADINQHPEIFHSEFNFLNIIIACEIFMACKFVFEEKFRKFKYSLFNKYEKISHRKEFLEVHGKSDLCQKQYVPSQFQQDSPAQNQVKESVIPSEIVKITNNILGTHTDSNRNELLYNYFRTTFHQKDSKKQYFPYFWLMFDDLNCSLVEMVQTIQDNQQDNANIKLKVLHKKVIDQLNSQIDYGIIGLYKSEKDKKLIIRGLVCLGSKSMEEFETNFHKEELIDIKFHKVDASNEKQRKQVQMLWQNVEQNTIQDQIRLILILHL